MSDLIDNDPYEEADLPGEEEVSDQELSEMESVEEVIEDEEIEATPPQGGHLSLSEALAQTLSERTPANPEEQSVPSQEYGQYDPYSGSPADPYQENNELDYSEQEILSQATQAGMMGREDFNQNVAFAKDRLDDPQFCREIIRMGRGNPVQIAKLLYQSGQVARQKAVDEQVLKDNRSLARAISNPINQPGTMNQSGRNRPNPYAKRDFSSLTMAEASVLLKQAHEAGPEALAKLIGEA